VLKTTNKKSIVEIPELFQIADFAVQYKAKMQALRKKFLSAAGCNRNKFEVNVFCTLLRAPDGNVARFSTFSLATGLFQRITRCKPRTLANFGHQLQGRKTNRYEHMELETEQAGACDSQIQREVQTLIDCSSFRCDIRPLSGALADHLADFSGSWMTSIHLGI